MTGTEQKLWDALKEAAYEICVMNGEVLCQPCKYLSEDKLHCAKEGHCFVSRWLKLLREVKQCQ